MSGEARDRVGVIETRGIEPVPDEERHGRAIGLFWMWFGANMGVLGITLGAALVTFDGLNVFQSFLVTICGAGGSFLLVGLLSIAGKRGGAPGLTLSRAVFGVRGNWGPTLVSWLGFVGWETVMCTTAAFALLALLGIFGLEPDTVATIICVLGTVVVTAVIGLFGHATIMWVQKWLTWVFGGLTLLVVIFLVTTVDWIAVLNQPAGDTTAVLGGIGFIAAGTGLGWLSAGADYSRYLSRTVKSRSIVRSTVLGAGIPLVVIVSAGALMALGDADLATANDPVAAIGASLPMWMLIPYLVTAVAGLIAGADLSMYSSGLNLITGGIKLSRIGAIGVDAVLVTLGGVYITVIAGDFYGPFTTFLTLLAVPLTAWAGVFLIDLVGRHYYDPKALLDTSRGSGFWYRGGVNWPAFSAWLIAIALGLSFTNVQVGGTAWFFGPFASSWVGDNSLGWLVAGATGATLFVLLRLAARQPTQYSVPPVADAQHAEEPRPKIAADAPSSVRSSGRPAAIDATGCIDG